MQRTRPRPRERWVTLIQGAHEGYACWENFERIQKMIIGNRLSDCEPSGAARRGSGLLTGFTGIRHYWENQPEVLRNALFVKDGPLYIRAQYSKLVNPIRRFLTTAKNQGIEICVVGQEKSGAFWDHLQLIGDDALTNSFFIRDHTYIREQIKHRPVAGAIYGKDTNYGAKVFVKLDNRYKFVLNVPNGDPSNPQNPSVLGASKIFGTLRTILSARYEDGLLPVELAHSVASLSTYPSAKVLSMFAEANGMED